MLRCSTTNGRGSNTISSWVGRPMWLLRRRTLSTGSATALINTYNNSSSRSSRNNNGKNGSSRKSSSTFRNRRGGTLAALSLLFGSMSLHNKPKCEGGGDGEREDMDIDWDDDYDDDYDEEDVDADGIDEEGFHVYSSSDLLPYMSDEGVPLERILLTEIPIPEKTKEQLKDASSDFSKSVRAFGSCVESTAAIRRRDTPLATTSSSSSSSLPSSSSATPQTDDGSTNDKNSISVEQRISTMGRSNENNETVMTRNVYFYKTSHIHDGTVDKFVLLAGPSSQDLGGDIGHLLGVGVSRAEVGKFADG